MNTVEKIVTLTFAVIALGLVLTNPNGDTAASNAISNTYTSGVKALQLR